MTYLNDTVNEARSFAKRKELYSLIIHKFVEMVREILEENKV